MSSISTLFDVFHIHTLWVYKNSRSTIESESDQEEVESESVFIEYICDEDINLFLHEIWTLLFSTFSWSLPISTLQSGLGFKLFFHTNQINPKIYLPQNFVLILTGKKIINFL